MKVNYSLNRKIQISDLYNKIKVIAVKFVEEEEAKIIASLIVKSEKMGVSSHGLHYFIHSVYPLLKQGYEPHALLQ